MILFNFENVSSQSYKEQGYDKEKEIEKEKIERIYQRLRVLNDEYEKKFGFMFVVFVNGRSKEQIIPVLEQRIKNGSKEDELALGLSEMMAIARDRLKKLRAKV